MTAFQERRRAQLEADRVAQAQSNLESGKVFMEEMGVRGLTPIFGRVSSLLIPAR